LDLCRVSLGADLGRQMDDGLRPGPRERAGEAIAVGETSGNRVRAGRVGAGSPHERADFVSTLQQLGAGGAAEESACSSNKNAHRRRA
jgi:hypothetical protein